MVFGRYFLLFLFFSSPVLAKEIDNRVQYDACMGLTQRDPEQAWERALAWESLGGGEAARHCAAVALIGLGQYEEAGKRLEALVMASHQSAKVRAGMLNHAGQAWSLAGNLERAVAAHGQAIKLDPTEPLYLLDRALVLAEAQTYGEAVKDLTAALAMKPYWAEALVLRASAYRYTEKLMEAEADLEKALRISPRNQEALLERGIIHRILHRDAEARTDWLTVIQIDPNSNTAEMARHNLQIMDGQGN